MTNATMRFATGAAALALPLTFVGPAVAAPAPAATAATATSAGAPAALQVQSKKGDSKQKFADTSWGPSAWEGRKLRHPNGRKFYPNVIRWANLVTAVMKEKGIKQRYLKGILAQIQQESSGNPNAVNNWDSNAAAGHPSKGLLQVIAPTYKTFAKDGYRNVRYQTVPYTNLWAALEYVKQTYGMKKFKYWNRGQNQGY